MTTNDKSSWVPSESDASPTTPNSYDSPEQTVENDNQQPITTPVHLDQRARGLANELNSTEPSTKLPVERPTQLEEEQKMTKKQVHTTPSTSISALAYKDDRPSSALPQLPPRNPYDHSIISSSYSQLPRSNQSIIRFMRLLSRWFLYGGTLSGIIVLLYQRYLFPSLQVRTRVLTELTTLGVKLYTKCLDRVGDVTKSYSRLLSQEIKEIEAQEPKISLPNLTPEIKPETETTPIPNEVSIQLSSEVKSKLQDHHISITQSLSRLTDLIRQRELKKITLSPMEERLKRQGIPFESKAPQPMITLHQTLKTFEEEMRSIRSSSTTSHAPLSTSRYFNQFLPQFSDSRNGKAEGVDKHQKVINEFKNEMRSLKGMLLNRRNFATWNPA